MNKKISLALLAAAGLASAQTTAAPVEDAAARSQAAAASQKATAAEAKASEVAKDLATESEKVENVEAKLESLNENYLETKTTVAGLAKLKISGLAQVQAVFNTDTNLVSGRPMQQSLMQVQQMRQ